MSGRTTAVLGIDLGTQSTKASLVALDGRQIGAHAVAVDFERPQPGWAEQAPEVLVTSTVAAIAALVARFPEVDVAGIGIAAQMGGAIGIDSGFRAVTPHEMWLDTRADADRAALLAAHRDAILAKNGIIPFVAPRVRRWLRLDPDLAASLARVVAPGGYLAGRLAGAASADMAVCDRTQANLFGCFDVAANAWDRDLAERCGLPPRLLPRIAEPFEIVGRLSEEAAAASGLVAGTPIAAGMGDGTGGWLAAGGVTPGVCIDTSGSSAHFAVTVDRFVADPSGFLACMPSAAPGRYYLLGFTTGTGITQRWLSRVFGLTYEDLESLAAAVARGATGILGIPHFNGRVSPFEPAMKGAFVGFDDKAGPGAFYRAMLEAAAYELDGWVGAARALAPEVTPAEVVNVGGGAQSALWNQIKADVTGLSFRTALPDVNAARGAALAAAVAIGAVAVDDAGWLSPEYLGARRFSPAPGAVEAYAPFRTAYAALTEQLLPIYRTLEGLRHPEPTKDQDHA